MSGTRKDVFDDFDDDFADDEVSEDSLPDICKVIEWDKPTTEN